MKTKLCFNAEDLAPFADRLGAADCEAMLSNQPDAHLLCLSHDAIAARCSLWWKNTPPHPSGLVGAIGHLRLSCAPSAQALLARACAELSRRGCHLAAGPLDGDTWHKYRLVTEAGLEPCFFLEPRNPPEWPQYFRDAGFASLAEYTSTLVADLAPVDPRVERAAARLHALGVRLRNLRADSWTADLRAIHQVSVQSFAGNFLYTPLEAPEFATLYEPLRSLGRPEFIFLAEQGDRPVGYVFAIPDFSEIERGAPPRTVIGKTLAVLPGRASAGLGVVLTAAVHARAQALGYRRVIHALQFAGNQVRNMSGQYGSVMRRYTLFGRALEAP